ncbi:lysozyme inhibitor LprI family protein [Novosphingobium album (ex Liu et al. 2023)]|uniref:Lysozyme inhibitor LprI family protein n=1 Tax=Novosphingobium album (ex Liu et al. 2023) TaxID=3031130 RepID=A0ABT5WWZ1_9SPHN|nr:lysozyme inhibitor LprI family protein [Novosphingobium album (ex Liu et al. 2023)]MDE8654368.1 lysozyme inhibitor LprI family protein [Novosphingobium album (ex Liu et al. 2023)]
MLLPLLAATAAPPDAGWNCADPVAQQEMNWCAAEEYRRADDTMNAQWQRTVAFMKERDTGLDRADDKAAGYFATLLAAQRAWLKYRDAHCAGMGFLFRDGSMEPLLVATCRTRLTEERTTQLKDLIEQ